MLKTKTINVDLSQIVLHNPDQSSR